MTTNYGGERKLHCALLIDVWLVGNRKSGAVGRFVSVGVLQGLGRGACGPGFRTILHIYFTCI